MIKIIFTVLFYLISKSMWIALIGLYLGYRIERWFKNNAIMVRPASAETIAAVKHEFLPFLFRSLGYLAKADGRVSEKEIAHVEQLMTRYNFDAAVREQAIDWFKEGVNQRLDFPDRLNAFAKIINNRPDIKKLMLELLIGLAIVDGDLHKEEEQVLLMIARSFGFNEALFTLLMSQWRGQSRFEQSNQNSLQEAYQVLGVKESDDLPSIKKAYRKLMSEHHPDKLIAQGVPEEAIKMATEKSQLIQSAYEKIKKHIEAKA